MNVEPQTFDLVTIKNKITNNTDSGRYGLIDGQPAIMNKKGITYISDNIHIITGIDRKVGKKWQTILKKPKENSVSFITRLNNIHVSFKENEITLDGKVFDPNLLIYVCDSYKKFLKQGS